MANSGNAQDSFTLNMYSSVISNLQSHHFKNEAPWTPESLLLSSLHQHMITLSAPPNFQSIKHILSRYFFYLVVIPCIHHLLESNSFILPRQSPLYLCLRFSCRSFYCLFINFTYTSQPVHAPNPTSPFSLPRAAVWLQLFWLQSSCSLRVVLSFYAINQDSNLSNNQQLSNIKAARFQAFQTLFLFFHYYHRTLSLSQYQGILFQIAWTCQ